MLAYTLPEVLLAFGLSTTGLLVAYLVYVFYVFMLLRGTSSAESRSSSFLDAIVLAVNYGL